MFSYILWAFYTNKYIYIFFFLFRQHWKDVTPFAKEFIDRLLVVDPDQRMTAEESLNHQWLTNANAAGSKNLHRTISQNLIHRQSIRSSKSAKSTRSTKSNKSNRSGRSLRSEHRRVMPEEIDELLRDPEVQADLMSIGWKSILDFNEYDCFFTKSGSAARRLEIQGSRGALKSLHLFVYFNFF